MTKEVEPVYAGGCHCGAVRYEAKCKPVVVAHCHCEDCQRMSGSGHSTGAMFGIENIKITGEVKEYRIKSDHGNEVIKSFCANCGSSLFGRNSGMQGFVTIALGTMDDSSSLVPEVSVFNRNRKPWDIMSKNIMVFETQPGWKPDDGVE